MKFSVLMAIYINDKPRYLEESLESILCQSKLPNEIVIVQDGIITKELESVLNKYIKEYEGLFKVVRLEKNVGLGNALAIGINECSNEIIARMDSDDICIENRFEKQIKIFNDNNNVDIVGSSIYEFYESKDKIKSERRVPITHSEIVNYAKKRNPMNHMTVMYKKSSVLEAGNYKDMLYCEDYYLWVRMIISGCIFYNIEEPLIYARTGQDMYKRRGGINYIKSEYRLQKELNKLDFIDKKMEFSNFIIRSIPRIIPNKLREIMYLRILRK